ncbi:hypothetical protein [Mucilaginibacter sp. BT774]|uniref:hypothetical protein n=1 Tax=Mucilaginibacter sp. BT774 TaxID=3062276 RepID=UPI002675884B|nr:hypothetical protein [Mucilaginibacter sp. BT774]MDO3628507.1 hypothetical protein [Mucilaginibacter sp. BT774]
MRKIFAIMIIGGAILAAGCSKKNNPGPSASADSYLPVSSGSTWTYNDVVGGNSSQLTITMTGATSIIGGKTYYAGTSVSPAKGTSTGYFYASNHFYSFRATSAAAGITIELQMGNDEQNVGYSWTTSPTDNGTVAGVPAKTVNTIKEKGITKVVNGKTFNNVIHTQIDLQYDLGTGFQSVAVYDIYLAKGVGMIENDTSVSGSPYEVETITGYTVK